MKTLPMFLKSSSMVLILISTTQSLNAAVLDNTVSEENVTPYTVTLDANNHVFEGNNGSSTNIMNQNAFAYQVQLQAGGRVLVNVTNDAGENVDFSYSTTNPLCPLPDAPMINHAQEYTFESPQDFYICVPNVTENFTINIEYTEPETTEETTTYVETAEDICYVDDVQTDGICTDIFSANCTKSLQIKSLNDVSNVEVFIDTTGLSGSLLDDCGVDNISGKNKSSEEEGYCASSSSVDAGPFDIFEQGVVYHIADEMPTDSRHTFYDYAALDLSFFATDKMYTSYVKDGVTYRGELTQCPSTSGSGDSGLAPAGTFNIVQTTFNDSYDPLLPIDPNYSADNALPTQVANRDFDVKILSLDVDMQHFKNYTGDVQVSIIPTPHYILNDTVGNQALCNIAQSLNTPQTVHLSNQSSKDFTVQNIADAYQNVSFKITYTTGVAPFTTTHNVCSRDIFAIRPDRFTLSAPIGEDPELLTSAQDYNLTLSALQYNTTDLTQKYTRLDVNGSDFTVLTTKYMPDNSINNGLAGDVEFADDRFNIINGISIKENRNDVVGVNFNDVAKINIKLEDRDWAQVDIANGDTPTDCSANGAYICGDINLTFIPDHFTISNAKVYNAGSNYTYFSNDLNISAAVGLTIEAKNSNDEIVKNFDKDSWENPIVADVDVTTAAPTPLNKNGISSAAFLEFIDGNATISQNETNSSKNIIFNYNRTNNTALNPLFVPGSDININIGSRYGTTTAGNTQDINVTANAEQNATFVYGRTYASRQRFSSDEGDAIIYYEVYCFSTGCNKDLLPNGSDSASNDDPRWFINANHDAPTQGRIVTIKEKAITPVVQAATPDNATPTKVTLTYDRSKGFPYKTTMQVTPSSWLLYNKYNISATTNDFAVEFSDSNAAWAGTKETETTTKNNASSKTTRRLMW